MQFGFIIAGTEDGSQVQIPQLYFGRCHQIYVPVDATQAKHVLIFQVTAIRPAVYFYSQLILARTHVAGDVETGVVVGALAVSYFLTVHPQIHGTVYTVEMNENLFVLPAGRQGKFVAIGTYGIRFGFLHRVAALPLYEGRVVSERISDISINGCSVAVHLPVGRNGNFCPMRYVVVCPVEIFRTVFGLFRPVEFPVAVQ